MDDAQIVLAIQQGDKEKFGLLYDKYIKKIYNFIFYKTMHRETAEDLTQKTFFKAFESLGGLKSESLNFSAWLYAIARNAVIDNYRTRKITYDITEVWDLSSNEDVARDVSNKNQLEQVKKYLDKLTPEQKEIIIMRLWDGLSYKEIGQILNAKEANLKVVFSRALQKLRQEMPIELFIAFIIGLTFVYRVTHNA